MATHTWNYNPVTQAVSQALVKICGPEAVVFGDARQLEKFSHDAVAEKQYAHMPDIVVFPSTAQQPDLWRHCVECRAHEPDP